MTFFRPQYSRFYLALLLAVLGGILCAWILPAEHHAVAQQILGFPDSDIVAHRVRPFILGFLCLLPALSTLLYCLGCTMDRYVIRQFTSIFFICFAALFLVWFLVDVNDNLSDFLDSKNTIVTVILFYGTRSPAIILFLLPYSLLLSLLYCLGKLSSDREIIAMIQSGRSVLRITAPLIGIGMLCSFLCLGLNYHWAPTAEGTRDDILNAARGIPVLQADNVMFRNGENRRLWMIGAFPEKYEKGVPLLNVEVTSSLPDKSIDTRLTASRAYWQRHSRTWTFENAVIATFKPGQPPIFETPTAPVVRTGWSETPWQLIKPGLEAKFLGIPDLNAWLNTNQALGNIANPAPYLTQWHYRIALPFACLVTVILATPLAIHFSRRGPGGGIFLAVVLSALMLLLSNIALAFGEASVMPPAVAAWLPNIGFALFGLYLYRRRSSGRPIYQSLRRLLPTAR